MQPLAIPALATGYLLTVPTLALTLWHNLPIKRERKAQSQDASNATLENSLACPGDFHSANESANSGAFSERNEIWRRLIAIVLFYVSMLLRSMWVLLLQCCKSLWDFWNEKRDLTQIKVLMKLY